MALLVVSLFPIVATLTLALLDSPRGFDALWSDARIWQAARRTLLLASVALPLELLLGLALACLFLGRMPGKPVFVYILAVPTVIAPIISGTAWRMLFDNDYGPVNQVLGWVVGGPVLIRWTEDHDFAFLAILIADIWQWTPFVFVLMLAALGNLDRRLLEAAEIDDAGPWRTLRHVVVPAILPAVGIAVLIRAFDLLRLFDVVLGLTRGGPDGATETLSVLAYDRLARTADAGGNAAMCFAAIVVVTLAAMLLLSATERDR